MTGAWLGGGVSVQLAQILHSVHSFRKRLLSYFDFSLWNEKPHSSLSALALTSPKTRYRKKIIGSLILNMLKTEICRGKEFFPEFHNLQVIEDHELEVTSGWSPWLFTTGQSFPWAPGQILRWPQPPICLCKSEHPGCGEKHKFYTPQWELATNNFMRRRRMCSCLQVAELEMPAGNQGPQRTSFDDWGRSPLNIHTAPLESQAGNLPSDARVSREVEPNFSLWSFLQCGYVKNITNKFDCLGNFPTRHWLLANSQYIFFYYFHY